MTPNSEMPEGRGASGVRDRARRAFTMVELLVVILIVGVLLSIFIPFVRKTRETDHRVRCAVNLRVIGQGLSAYAKANGGSFPRVVHDAANAAGRYYVFTGAFAANPFAGDGRASANDVTASLWLLVRDGYVPATAFICPSSGDQADTMTGPDGAPALPAQRSNFRRPRNLSYSYASPFSASPDYRFDSNWVRGDFVILADKNPGKSAGSDVTAPAFNAPPLELARANSHNHNRAGQNMLYADGHVDFWNTPYRGYGYYDTGTVGDNIYTALAAAPLADQPPPEMTVRGVLGADHGPAWKADSYLVPTADDDRAP